MLRGFEYCGEQMWGFCGKAPVPHLADELMREEGCLFESVMDMLGAVDVEGAYDGLECTQGRLVGKLGELLGCGVDGVDWGRLGEVGEGCPGDGRSLGCVFPHSGCDEVGVEFADDVPLVWREAGVVACSEQKGLSVVG